MKSKIFSKFVLHALCILSLVLIRGKTTTAKKCIDKDRQALLGFKANLEDPEGRLSTWRPEEDECCKWSGVTCNNTTGRVTELVLSNFDTESALGGEISLPLLNLSYLNHLDLSGNSFNGTIPRFIGSLTNLKYLNLDSNSFYGNIPPELGNLTNLQELSLRSLGNCTIENLDWLSHLSHLEHLNIDDNSLAKVDYWVNLILGLGKLSTLSLGGCNLSNVLRPYTSSLNSSSSSIVRLYLPNNNLNSSMYHWFFPLTSNKLQYIHLANNNLEGIPEYFGNLCSLVSLYFYGNPAYVGFSDFMNKLSGCTSFTLQALRVGNCQLTGPLSDDIKTFSSLKHLHLAHNSLNGTISKSLWELPKLETLDISSNHLRGAIFENIGKSNLSYIDLSNNSLDGVPVTSKPYMSNLSNVDYIDLSTCKLGPVFPKWIQTLKNLTQLNIAKTRISDTIPLEFWNSWPSRLTYLNLSSNNITGEVKDLLSNFDLHSSIDLSSNNFSGPILNVSTTLETLDLSGNKFSGGITFLCQIVDGFLTFLDLSDNSFRGHIPDCLWHFKRLKVLNLGHNNLFGRLPASIESLNQLEVLYLYNNEFSGELPSSLKNCTSINFLNLGANKFSGNVPVWIGENLSGLYVLSLRSNHFLGTIPIELCQLVNLQILDLSINNLNGTIPSCVNNLTTMVQEGLLSSKNIHNLLVPSYTSRGAPIVYFESGYADQLMIQWQGNIRQFTTNLGLLKSIDLSSNNLTGDIPAELTDLHGLHALNMSKNALLSEIPPKIGQMKSLLTLDLSRNNLSGRIPSSMSQMTLLNYLDVSYNNLSGRIPSSTQLQSFEPSRYTGNGGLYGPPLTKNCPGDEDSEASPTLGKNEDDGKVLDSWFYIGGATGFPMGLLIVCSTLLLNRRVRFAFNHHVHRFENLVYVKQ
ncbi:receptor-like protein EIX2 [Tanacetum coccineum]